MYQISVFAAGTGGKGRRRRRTQPHSHSEKIRGGFPDELASCAIASDIRWYSRTDVTVRRHSADDRAVNHALPYTPSRMTSSKGTDGRGRRPLLRVRDLGCVIALTVTIVISKDGSVGLCTSHAGEAEAYLRKSKPQSWNVVASRNSLP